MHATRKALTQRIALIDVVIELLDARLPGSSANPMLAELTGGKPGLKVLNKQDLADPACTAQWLAHYNAQQRTRAIALDASQAAPARALIAACRALAPHRGKAGKPMRVLICGIPNVGKSTLINTLAGRRKAPTGDEPGITKLEQRIVLADDFYLWDTPGMLWPRIIVEQSGYNLAASGAVGRNAYDEQEVALELLETLRRRYPQQVRTRFKLQEDIGAWRAEEILQAIGRQRGTLLGGGQVNLQKAAEIVLNDFRGGVLGRITLETPEEYALWLAEGRAKDALRAERKQARQKKGKNALASPDFDRLEGEQE
jgi:ribosome biogenesis GTPase A